jgi:hypothetical protein
MSRRADQLAPDVDLNGFWKENARFFNGGSSGRWRDLLGEEDLSRYWSRVRELATPDLADWVHNGSQAAQAR